VHNLKKFIQTTFGFILLGLIVWGGYELSIVIVSIFKTIDPKLAAGIVVASATVLVSVITVLFSKKQENKANVENHLREKKIPIYKKIIEFIFLITFAEKCGKEQPTEEEMMQFFADTTRDLVIWGSKDIVNAYGDFKDVLSNFAEINDTTAMLAAVEDLFFAIRKDLGHTHKNDKRGDILRLYVNDTYDYFPQLNK
jgi:hypothetical protein